MAFTEDHRLLHAVNAGSDDITGFRVAGAGLEPNGAPVPSGGQQPISLTVESDLLYVLNAGNGGNVSPFRIATGGTLAPIPGSTRPLSGQSTGPAQIQFTPNGDVLVVTEKNTNDITTYVVGADGRAGAPQTVASAGLTPFGFSFNQRSYLVVSEARASANCLSTASSYLVGCYFHLSLFSSPF